MRKSSCCCIIFESKSVKWISGICDVEAFNIMQCGQCFGMLWFNIVYQHHTEHNNYSKWFTSLNQYHLGFLDETNNCKATSHGDSVTHRWDTQFMNPTWWCSQPIPYNLAYHFCHDIYLMFTHQIIRSTNVAINLPLHYRTFFDTVQSSRVTISHLLLLCNDFYLDLLNCSKIPSHEVHSAGHRMVLANRHVDRFQTSSQFTCASSYVMNVSKESL